MDLCCLIAGTEDDAHKKAAPPASELVEVLGKLIREETDYTVMPLPKARIPIIKISRAPTAELPYEISCDIGFENRLALENTRLLLTYAMVDPPRLRTLVLFLKVWTKRRKLNSPYTGTLSSYGYTLLMIFFLTHVKRPAVLPNLQQMPPSSNSTRSENVNLNGHNTYFYDDVATLHREWSSTNTENVGELLIDFFRYFSKEFVYSKDVVSIRTEAGLKAKDGQTWSSELCIEDPFQAGYNVARTVTRDGLYTIRGEFMRASRILTTRSERVSSVLAELCEEREDGLTRAPDTPYYQRHRSSFASPSSAYNSASSAGFDPRYLQDLARRYDLSNNTASGFGGSFAFEEMARGLGQAQKSSNVMAYPPTTAMLAPLSQNTGLSPRQHLMRAGLRYDTPRRGQSGAPASMHPASINMIGSSTRSEDGNSNYEKKKTKKGGASSNVSAQTSPNIDNSAPTFVSATSNGYGVGEALAFGSEISFGSQRFQLHPQSTIAASRPSASRAVEEDPRAPRSFSEGLNRSLSLPRPGVEGKEKRRSSTPLLSEPTSPSKICVGLAASNKYLEPSTAALSLSNIPSSPRSSMSESGQNKRISVPLFTSQAGHANHSGGGLGDKSLTSPFLPPSPWSSAEPDNRSRDSRVILTPEEDGSFGLDDEPASISDAGESARLDTSQDQSNGVCSVDVQDQELSRGKEHAIRSWAASQSVGVHTHENE
jgi:terminal uridylyltransferase